MQMLFCLNKMDMFWIFILVSFIATNSFDKAETVQLEELPLQTFDELFVEEWWDIDEAKDLKTPAPTNFGQNAHHQIDRQNTQLGQIEHNSTDQNPPLTKSDQAGQIQPNSTDQNLPLTESDHSDNAKNDDEQNEIIKEMTSSEKRKIVDKFHALKGEFKQKGKYSKKEWTQIEEKIANYLKINRKKIYKWKKEFGLSSKKPKNERKNLVEKFDQMKAELKLAGIKNSNKEINETVAKELGITYTTIYNWKQKLGQTTPKHIFSHSEQKELMEQYYEIKDQNSKIRDVDIAKMLKIGSRTLVRWKSQFKRQQLNPNSVEENAAANVHQIENSNSECI